MTITAKDLELSRPCPVDLDAEFASARGKRHYCDHCSKDVHMLSAMTKGEAEKFLAANEGKDICISYKCTSDGKVAFAPEPVVPVASLLKKRPKRRNRLATLGMTAALAACTPHGPPQQLQEETVEQVEIVAGGLMVPDVVPEPEPEPEVEAVRGKMAFVEEQVDEVDDEVPCETEVDKPETETKVERPMPRRGRRVSRPKPKPEPKRVPKEREMMVGFL